MVNTRGAKLPPSPKGQQNDTITREEQKILTRDGKNTQKNYTKKDLHDPDNHDRVIIHLEPDILECEVKWETFFF